MNSDFAGTIQHDAHEFLEILLDKMHEDLNRVEKKPYTENVEKEGFLNPEENRELADETWRRFLLRENSAVKVGLKAVSSSCSLAVVSCECLLTLTLSSFQQ